MAVTVLAIPAGGKVNCTFSPTFTFASNVGGSALKVMVIAG